ncbi:hypothetical protein SLNWT_5159 [Streptomyces albus]|uniref:Uncharacterized protein n=1 Tax=Streptomyces albus (strain ATCC 21838 / DSM 41398 / FERM P-419 / JCM 4703 / NBRC 107858) TaxID=1081613 RepID=A0A0B5F1R7_STRA4|nr:hypothetical protein SLNWT_5159 [Streptomyces albus]AOU79839.1 hypothetical protein SLNHY_5148 [Streptomyces albus]AYN35562.1 hypothetical protein DUI70_5064 [Streptomyces albus]
MIRPHSVSREPGARPDAARPLVPVPPPVPRPVGQRRAPYRTGTSRAHPAAGAFAGSGGSLSFAGPCPDCSLTFL